MEQGKNKENINQAYQLILSDIIKQKRKPGDWLKEKEICDMAGVGRSSVRNAFDLLEQVGLVEREPNRGARVVSFSRTQLAHLLETKDQIEASVIFQTHMLYTEQDFQSLEAIIADISQSITERDFVSYLNQVGKFHNTVVDKLGNEYYSEIFRLLMNKYLVFQMLYDLFYIIDVKEFTVVESYRGICEAIRRRKPDRAAAALKAMADRTMAYYDMSLANRSASGNHRDIL